MMRVIIILLSSLFILLSGCAYQQEDVSLQPQLVKQQTNLGQGRQLAIVVEDVRPAVEEGLHWAIWGKGSQIKLDKQLTATTTKFLQQSFARLGFVTGPQDPRSRRVLNIQIQKFSSEQNLVLGATAVTTTAQFVLVSQNGPDRYQRLYKAQASEQIPPTVTTDAANAQINQVYSNLLNQIITDRRLLLALEQEILID